ncbi:MAG: M15 family metallopeptidase [Methylophilaceae bacterium]
MTLREKQSKFALLVSQLIAKAYEMGFEVTIGDAYRDPRVHGKMGEKKSYSSANSCHKLRLAIDLNLFKDGTWLQSTVDYRVLGEWWEAQGGAWGGRFKDGNHFSFEHDGFK